MCWKRHRSQFRWYGSKKNFLPPTSGREGFGQRCSCWCWKQFAQGESCDLSFIWGQNEDCNPGDMLQIALRNCSKEAREELVHTGALRPSAGSLNIRRSQLIKETRYVKLRNLALFLCMRRCSLGSLKSFLSYASRLFGPNISCFRILPGDEQDE